MVFQFETNDDPLEKITTTEAIRTLVDSYRTSQYCYLANQKVEEMSKIVSLVLFHNLRCSLHHLFIRKMGLTVRSCLQKGTVLDSGGSQASFFMQAFTLTKRSFVNMSRDFGYYWLRLVIYVVVTVCIGTIYLNVGTGYSSILVRYAICSMLQWGNSREQKEFYCNFFQLLTHY